MNKFSLLFAGALSLFAASAYADIYQPKDGELVIHYFRPDGAYGTAPCKMDTCWGVHSWGEAYQYEGMWTKPVFAAGTDDFGAYYVIKANKDKKMLDKALARYIIHKGQLKDQKGKDQSWEVKNGKQIFVINNQCQIYFNAEEAMAAKALPPKNDCKEAVTY